MLIIALFVYSSEGNSLLFVHQTPWQQRMLQRYGAEICLLDATYKTSHYDLPLFFLSVPTNVGYTVVGSFIVEKETSANILEALEIIHDHNPAWTPSYFMVDFDQREIQAIQHCFPGRPILF